jgi:hypothetical protein
MTLGLTQEHGQLGARSGVGQTATSPCASRMSAPHLPADDRRARLKLTRKDIGDVGDRHCLDLEGLRT